MNEIPPIGARERDRDLAINELIRGRSNATNTITLTAGAASTTYNRSTINANAAVFLFPRTPSAAAAFATTYANVTEAGRVVIGHANTAETDRTFYIAVLGG